MILREKDKWPITDWEYGVWYPTREATFHFSVTYTLALKPTHYLVIFSNLVLEEFLKYIAKLLMFTLALCDCLIIEVGVNRVKAKLKVKNIYSYKD